MTQSEKRDEQVRIFENLSLWEIVDQQISKPRHTIPTESEMSALVQAAIDGDINPGKVAGYFMDLYHQTNVFGEPNDFIKKCMDEAFKIPKPEQAGKPAIGRFPSPSGNRLMRFNTFGGY